MERATYRMNIKFRVTIAIAVAVLALASAIAMPNQAYANEIEAGKWYSVTLNPHDVVTSTYTMPEKGYFYLETKGVYSSLDSYIRTIVTLTHDDVDYYRNLWSSVNVIESSRCVSLGKGAQAIVQFENNNSWVDSIDYRIVQVKPKYAEQEPNDWKSKANPLKRNKTLTGVLNDSEDIDWFSFKAPKKSRYKIQLRVTAIHEQYNSVKYNAESQVFARKGWKTVDTVKMRKGSIKKFKIVPCPDISGPNGTVYEVRVVRG